MIALKCIMCSLLEDTLKEFNFLRERAVTQCLSSVVQVQSEVLLLSDFENDLRQTSVSDFLHIFTHLIGSF